MLFNPVVVAKEQKELIAAMELFKELVYLSMGIIDVGEAAVFPEFITVAQFNICEIVLKIML